MSPPRSPCCCLFYNHAMLVNWGLSVCSLRVVMVVGMRQQDDPLLSFSLFLLDHRVGTVKSRKGTSRSPLYGRQQVLDCNSEDEDEEARCVGLLHQ